MAIKIEDVYNLCTQINAKLVQVQAVQNSHTALLNGLVDAGQIVSQNLIEVQESLGQREDSATLHTVLSGLVDAVGVAGDGASLHAISEASQDILAVVQSTVADLEGKIS